MNLLKKSGLAAVMGLLAFSVFTSNVAKAETNPFAAQDIMTVVAADGKDDKCGEGKAKGKGKCGEGKCGESKAKAKKGKCGEGKCGESKAKAKKGKCGEGKCGEGKSKAKAKCGEGKSKGKCGEGKKDGKKCGG